MFRHFWPLPFSQRLLIFGQHMDRMLASSDPVGISTQEHTLSRDLNPTMSYLDVRTT